jgi:3-isopropylmalate/(R)-2-methylmalate dehydratase small subunit
LLFAESLTMQQITEITGSGVPLLLDDIDTDRIIPARFLRCVTFDGLGEHAFEDDRQQDHTHPFDDPHYQGGSVLIAGRNFGCGSSREHAPQALIRWGIKAIVGESFAEIFFGNCTTLGVPCVCASRANLEQLAALVKAEPELPVTVDLAAHQVRAGHLTVPITILDSARVALTTGKWDFLGQLLEGSAEVKQTAAGLPYMAGFKA